MERLPWMLDLLMGLPNGPHEPDPRPIDGTTAVMPGGKPIENRACCCPSRPAVGVVLPLEDGRQIDLLFCVHHYRGSREKLKSRGAEIYLV